MASPQLCDAAAGNMLLINKSIHNYYTLVKLLLIVTVYHIENILVHERTIIEFQLAENSLWSNCVMQTAFGGATLIVNDLSAMGILRKDM